MSTIEDRLAALERQNEQLAGKLTTLADKEAIREVIHRYCRAADRCDLEAFKSCYWPDGFDDHGFFGGNAWEFCEYVIPVLKKIEASVHAITNTIIELKGDRAFCESQWSVVHRLKEGDTFLDFWHQGRYLDIFERRDAEWKILTRTAATDTDRLIRSKDIRTALANVPGGVTRGPENNLPRGARYPNDPVYEGFNIGAVAKERTPMKDLWTPFFALAKIM